jgi:hypothetical protein
MAIKLSANYSKKLGLPNYSSHSFSASVEVELTDISQVEQEVQGRSRFRSALSRWRFFSSSAVASVR